MCFCIQHLCKQVTQQNLVSAQYLESKVTDFHQILHLGQELTKGVYTCVHQNLANVVDTKYYLLRAFLENLKHLSSILMNMWRFEAT